MTHSGSSSQFHLTSLDRRPCTSGDLVCWDLVFEDSLNRLRLHSSLELSPSASPAWRTMLYALLSLESSLNEWEWTRLPSSYRSIAQTLSSKQWRQFISFTNEVFSKSIP